MKKLLLLITFCCSLSTLFAQENTNENVNKNAFSANPTPLLALTDIKTASPSAFFEYKRKVKKGYFRLAIHNRLLIEDVNYNLYGAPQQLILNDTVMKIGFLKNQTAQSMLRIGKEKQFIISKYPKWHVKGSYDFLLGKKTVSEIKVNEYYKKINGVYTLQRPNQVQIGADDYIGITVVKDYYNVGASIGTGLGFKLNNHLDLSFNAFMNLFYASSRISNVNSAVDVNINFIPTFSILF